MTEPPNEHVGAEKSETTQRHDSFRELVNSIDGTIGENATVIDEACLEKPESISQISTVQDGVIGLGSAKVSASDDDNSMAEDRSRTHVTNIMIDVLSAPNDEIAPIIKDASGEVLQSVCANNHHEQESNPESSHKEIPDDYQTGEIPREHRSINFLEAVDNTAPVIPPLMPLTTANLTSDTSQETFEKGDKLNNDGDGDISAVHVSEGAEVHTEEEEEWLSMGLGLGDALRQIVALTDERDLALAVCQEKDDRRTQVEALFEEVQTRLQAEMSRRAESDSELRKVRESMKLYEDRLSLYETMEDDLEKANAGLVALVAEKTKIEIEVAKLRQTIEESEQKEAILSNRLNEAKKKEANKASAAGRLDAENEQLREDLQRTSNELDIAMKAKTKLEVNMEKLKAKAVERVKQAETALAEERELNEERKKKMKTYVENKAEEVKTAKECANDMQKELEETRASLRSSRDREEAFQKEVETTRLKNRELQREMERMKRSSEQLHQAGNSLEQELEKYASETEEHKKKRMSAKHEIMQMVRTLESERAVSAKLKEALKFTLTPKALSQQELLTECLREFDLELERLAIKTGKALQPSAESSEKNRNETINGPEASDINGELYSRSKKSRSSRADVDTERLISNLEQETQHISKGIMALAGNIDRMRSLLNDENMFGCMSYFSNILGGTGEARHQRLTENDAHHEENNAASFV
jgi:myosin heavy subunit